MVDLASSRPMWRAPRNTIAAIRRAFGRGWTVRVVRSAVSSDGDGGAPSPASLRAVRGAEVYVGWGVAPDVLRVGQGTLRWVHTASAGVGVVTTAAMRGSGIVLTNSRGIHAHPIADWTIAALGYCARGFHDAVAAQRRRRWIKGDFTDGSVRVREFSELRVGLVGLGGVGSAIARRCRALGMEVRAVRRRPGRRRPAGVRSVGGPRSLRRLAAQSDVLIVAAPLTRDTRRVIDGGVLRALPRGAFVINLSRGSIVDEVALVRELDRGRLGGAVLDVFAVEPLPASSPLWRHERVLVSPHVSGVSNRFWPRETALIVDNVRRYRSRRRLKNIVDLTLGY